MGRLKHRALEQGEAGFSYEGNQAVCASCIPDDALARFVDQHEGTGDCDFCARRDTAVVGLHELFVEMGTRIRAEFAPHSMSAEVPGGEWEMDVPTLSSEDLLEHLGHPLRDGALAAAFAEAFRDDWVAHGVWSGTPDVWLAEGWERFVDVVKRSSRFVFLHDALKQERFRTVDIDPADMLDRLAEVIERCELVIPYPAGQPAFRGRKHAPDEALIGAPALGAPVASKATAQRMSPTGIAFFYGSTDEATALAELRGLAGELATIAEWITARDCFILDLARLPEVPSIFDRQKAGMRPQIRFLHRFATEVSQPLLAHDDPQVDYVPTQIVAEYIRHCVHSRGGEPVSGIMYRSAARAGGVNLGFFVDGDDLASEDPLLAYLGPPVAFEAAEVQVRWNRKTK